MTWTELRYKEVINLKTGQKLGYVCDCELEPKQGRMLSLIVPGRSRFFGLFGREDDYVIPWEQICVIGEDLVLVEQEAHICRRKRQRKKVF
ncbi:MAG: YlmC/YmxH family sporulation protein [Eubacteriales bacterium]|jgi:YlmC/YmxH family sporulation protein